MRANGCRGIGAFRLRSPQPEWISNLRRDDRYEFVILCIGAASTGGTRGIPNVRGPNVLRDGIGSSEGNLVTKASTTADVSTGAREVPIADHARAGVTIAALLCVTSAATFLTLFP